MNTDVERLQKLILHSPEALDLTGVQEVREHSSHTAEGSGRDALGTSLSISHYCVECSPCAGLNPTVDNKTPSINVQ